ncbi:MAG: hypothetical protein IPK75_18765 [Acidobacteria bacterium]|nr:hypothetical protein [Acidobacteriota bacterium]
MSSAERRALELELELLRRGGEQPQAPQESDLRSGARAFAQGATFGFQDEAAGLMGAAASLVDPRVSAGPGEVYRDIQQAEQAAQNQFAEQNPGQNLALQVAGGVLNPASKATMGMDPLKAGAIAGAVTGAGNAQGTGVADTIGGAAVGGGTGLVFGAGAQLAGQAWNRLAPGVRGRMVALAKSTGMSPQQLAERLRAFGPAGTLADISDNTRDAGGTLAARLGLAKQRIQAYERRAEQAFGRLMQPIIRGMGSRAQGVQTEAQLRAALEQQASPLYEQAFAQPIQMTDRLRDLLRRPEVQSAWRRTQRVGANDLGVSLDDLRSGALPSFRGWQYITELLYDKQAALFAKQATKEARNVRALRQALLSELDAQSPAFQQARSIWSGAKTAEDSLAAGESFLRDSVDKVIDTVQDMDPGDLPFYRIGVGRALQAKLETLNDNADITRALRNPAFRAKLRTAMGDDALAADFVNSVRVEQEFQKTFNQLSRQSATAGRQAMAEQLTGAGVVGDVTNAAGQGLWDTARQLLRNATGPREATMQTLGDLLTTQDPARQRVAIALMQEQPEMMTPAAMSRLYFLLGQQAANQRGQQ